MVSTETVHTRPKRGIQPGIQTGIHPHPSAAGVGGRQPTNKTSATAGRTHTDADELLRPDHAEHPGQSRNACAGTPLRVNLLLKLGGSFGQLAYRLPTSNRKEKTLLPIR